MPHSPANQLASLMRVQNQRRADAMDIRRPMPTVLPDPQWDAFSGALQSKAESVAAEGKRFLFKPPPFAGLARAGRGRR